MSNLYGSSYQDSFQPTFSPATRDENRRSFLDLNQPLTAMGRRQPNHIQTPAPNLYLPQPTFSPTYDPATQNFQVASHQEFDRSEDIHVPHDEGDRFRSQQPAGGIAYYVSDTFCETPLAHGDDWDFSSPPVSDPSTCGSFQYYNSAEGSVEWQTYEIPCEDQLAYDAFGQPHYSAVNLLPYRSQHPPISPTQHSSYSELSANVLFLSELSRAESKISKTPITPSEPKTQQTSTKAKRKSSSIGSRAGQTKGSVGATPTSVDRTSA